MPWYRNVRIPRLFQRYQMIQSIHYSPASDHCNRSNILYRECIGLGRGRNLLVRTFSYSSSVFTNTSRLTNKSVRSIPLAYGVLLMALAVYKAAELLKEDPLLNKSKLTQIIIRDQVVYFMA